MDDPIVFSDFLTRAGLTVARQRTAIIDNLCETFTEFSVISEEDISAFVTRNDQDNRTRAAAQRVILTNKFITSLKAVLFEFHDRRKCLALPDVAALNGIDVNRLRDLRVNYANAVRDNTARTAQRLPEMTSVKLTTKSWGEWKTNFQEVLSRIYGVNKIPLTYVVRNMAVNNYNVAYASRMERLVACCAFQGEAYREDNQKVWSLLVQHVGDVQEGKAIITRFKTSKNGRATWEHLISHFESDSYKQNLKQTAKSKINEAHYSGELPTFGMSKYHTIFSTAFNDLEEAGEPKSEEAKISDFRLGILDSQAINCCSQADSEFKQLPLLEQTFEAFYNLMKGKLDIHITQHSISRNRTTSGRTATIRNINSSKPGRGRGRGRGRGGRGGRYNNGGRNHGGFGRGGRGSNNSFYDGRNAFYPQAKMYPQQEWQNLTRDQKRMVEQVKVNQGWKNSSTPPDGYVIDTVTGLAVGSTANRSISHVNSFAPLPPPPPNHIPQVPATTPPPIQVPTAIQVPQGSAGSAFGRRNNDDDQSRTSTISKVTIDGRVYVNGPVYDANGNRIN